MFKCIAEQLEKDLESDKEGLEEAKKGVEKLRRELDQLNVKYKAEEVSNRACYL